MKKHLQDSLVIGFALFSMFFGAGNVIFPPYLGLESGPEWLAGFFSYFMADIGLALLAMFAILRQGSPDGITARIGRIPSTALMCAIVLCIGPMLAIPRTAATTYETSLAPLVSGFSPALFSILFFLLILLLCVRETAVVDIVGKILTPALLIGLLILIVVGVVNPIGPVGEQPLVENVAATGVEAGYQTMDVLAAIVFGYIILKSAREKGHTTPGRPASGGVRAQSGGRHRPAAVYLGLTYLGATTARFFDITVDRTFLVVSIVRNLLGQAGIILFAVVVALACVTTAVGLVSACADYFSGLSGAAFPTARWCASSACSVPWYPTLVSMRSSPSPPHPQRGLSPHAGADRAGPVRQPHPPGLGVPPGGPRRPGSEPAGGSPHLHRRGAGLSGPAAPGVSGFRLGVARRCLRRSGRPDPRWPDCRLLMPYFHFSHTGGLIV